VIENDAVVKGEQNVAKLNCGNGAMKIVNLTEGRLLCFFADGIGSGMYLG
jgi:hypothetical protein